MAEKLKMMQRPSDIRTIMPINGMSPISWQMGMQPNPNMGGLFGDPQMGGGLLGTNPVGQTSLPASPIASQPGGLMDFNAMAMQLAGNPGTMPQRRMSYNPQLNNANSAPVPTGQANRATNVGMDLLLALQKINPGIHIAGPPQAPTRGNVWEASLTNRMGPLQRA